MFDFFLWLSIKLTMRYSCARLAEKSISCHQFLFFQSWVNISLAKVNGASPFSHSSLQQLKKKAKNALNLKPLCQKEKEKFKKTIGRQVLLKWNNYNLALFLFFFYITECVLLFVCFFSLIFFNDCIHSNLFSSLNKGSVEIFEYQ